jgi:hypothetical protein
MSEQLRTVNRPRTLLVVAMAVCLGGGAAAQQQPAAAPAAKAQPASAATAGSAPAPGAASQAAAPPPATPAYTYSPDGRRDPFISLVGKGSDAKPGGARPAGVAGLLINEVGIKGIVRDRTGFIAMVQGADNRTYVIRPGDRLMDGTVKAIVQDAVVFSQDVNDPLSLVKQKEIRKNMRSPEGGRG